MERPKTSAQACQAAPPLDYLAPSTEKASNGIDRRERDHLRRGTEDHPRVA
jgi:hypothetical protein